jgi:hypothetical protein
MCRWTALALLLALTAPGTPAVAAKDILMVVLEDAAGKTSLHYQASADCMAFLSRS